MVRSVGIAAVAAAAAAVATVAVGTPMEQLPTASRKFYADNVQAVWTRVAGDAPNCPASLEFTTYDGSAGTSLITIGHSTIIHDGRRCDGNADNVLSVISSDLLAEGASGAPGVPDAVAAVLAIPQTSTPALQVADLAQAAETFYVAVAATPLFCNQTTMGAGAAFVFARPFAPIEVTGLSLQIGFKYMMVTPGAGAPSSCVYAALVNEEQGVTLDDLNLTPGAEPSEEPDASAEPFETPDAGVSPPPAGAPPAPTPSPTASPACFPADATVVTADGAVVRMADVADGDVLRTSPTTTGRVYFFSHADADGDFDFVRLTTAAGAAITLSPGHYLPVRAAGARGAALAAASTVAVGDELTLASGALSTVARVAAVTARGLYNPHLTGGAGLLVDGVWASELTTAVAPAVAGPALRLVRAAAAATRAVGVVGLRLPSAGGIAARLVPAGAPVVEL